MIRSNIKAYIEQEIIPLYDGFDAAHNRKHVEAVISNSLKYARLYDADEEKAYVIAAYHDIGLSEGRKYHHIASARKLKADAFLHGFYNDAEISEMADAVEDHRASSDHEPRSIYGKIVAEADRMIIPDLVVERTVQYGLSHYPELDKEEHYARVVAHLKEKYGRGGYLKLWLDKSDNAVRLEELRKMIDDEALLREKFERFYIINTENGISVSFVGSGNVATQMALSLRNSGVCVECIFSRSLEHAESLAVQVGARAVNDYRSIPQCDFVIFSVSDAALEECVSDYLKEQSKVNSKRPILIHTAGSMPPGNCDGVLYPLQTFSRGRQVDFSTIPLFVEAVRKEDLHKIFGLARRLTADVREMDTEQRRWLHLAAVYACNFTNHLYNIAEKMVEKSGADFTVLLPLIDETARKVHVMQPAKAQTGPASRLDLNVMGKHLSMLANEELPKKIYEVLSDSIASMTNKCYIRNGKKSTEE